MGRRVGQFLNNSNLVQDSINRAVFVGGGGVKRWWGHGWKNNKGACESQDRGGLTGAECWGGGVSGFEGGRV